MRGRVLLGAIALVLVLATPARAAFLLHVDASTERGHLRMLIVSDPGTHDLAVTENGRPVGGKFEPFAGNWLLGTAIRQAGVWKCSRRDRTFLATAIDPNGTPVRSPFSVRTPSCANRLTLQTAPHRATVVDSFGLGGVHAQLCARTCRTVAIPKGATSASAPIRGPRVVLRTRYQRTVQRVGDHAAGGPVVLTTGDSLMQNLNVILQDRLAGRVDLRSDIKFGSSLSYEGYFGPWADIARAQVARLHPRATVIFLGSNDVYPIGDIPCCGTDWEAAYEKRARTSMQIYAQGGAGRVIWLTVPINRSASRVPGELAANVAIRRAAATVPGAAVVPTDEILTPGGKYRARIDGVRVREPDGVHLSLAGSRITAPYVLDALQKLGLP